MCQLGDWGCYIVPSSMRLVLGGPRDSYLEDSFSMDINKNRTGEGRNKQGELFRVRETSWSPAASFIFPMTVYSPAASSRSFNPAQCISTVSQGAVVPLPCLRGVVPEGSAQKDRCPAESSCLRPGRPTHLCRPQNTRPPPSASLSHSPTVVGQTPSPRIQFLRIGRCHRRCQWSG